MANFIGIDLGTTFSAVARIDETGRSIILVHQDTGGQGGRNIMPSVVRFESADKKPVVGWNAKQTLFGDKNTHGRFKRKMGTSKTYAALGKNWTPMKLSAFVLDKLRMEAEAQIGKIDGAVVTIPANFGNEARRATMDAAKAAGLDVKFIINEPTAAALYYASKSKQKMGGVYAVYDLGGGTFDVSIIRLSGQDVEVLATDGVAELGGDDFDRAIQKLVNAKYADATGGQLEDSDYTLEDAEKDKISLSSLNEVGRGLRGDAGKANIAVTREEFEEAISPLVGQTEMLCETALDEAKVTPSDIKGVFLAGGSTRIPKIMESVKKIFKQEPMSGENVDEVVALGAALYAAYKADRSALNSLQKSTVEKTNLAEITSRYFGTLALTHDENRNESSIANCILIPKGDKVPCSVTKSFYTVANGQEYIDCDVTESGSEETDPRFVDLIWKGELQLPAARPAGQEIQVTFSYDENQRMHCSFVDVTSGKQKEINLGVGASAASDGDNIERFTVE